MADNLPIVFLPGIMGSRLYFPNSEKYWDPDNVLRMSEWIPVPLRSPDKLRKQMSFLEPAVVVSDDPNDRGWSGVPASFYTDFLGNLQARFPNAPVYAIGYDWRQDNWSTADAVVAKIREILAREHAAQVQVVTHSMGGLVFRAALAKTKGTAQPLAALVKGVVHVFQPVYGAVVLYRRLFTGVQVPGLDGEVTLHDVGGTLSNLAFAWILGDNAIDFTGKVSGMPGAMQLVPSNSFPPPPWNQSFSGANGQTIYDLYRNPPTPPSVLVNGISDEVRADMLARLAEVAPFYDQISGVKHDRTWTVVGGGLKTDTMIAFNGNNPQATQAANGGDGTVPLPSGAGLLSDPPVPFDPEKAIGDPCQFLVEGVAHANAFAKAVPNVQSMVMQIVGAI
ncbi:MAG: hypothetical protein JOZ53_01775 [Planctomycetaceae bacterium]|nr:hypothetical protein [Planctomycetaceae bacterium]